MIIDSIHPRKKLGSHVGNNFLNLSKPADSMSANGGEEARAEVSGGDVIEADRAWLYFLLENCRSCGS